MAAGPQVWLPLWLFWHHKCGYSIIEAAVVLWLVIILRLWCYENDYRCGCVVVVLYGCDTAIAITL